MLSWKRLYVLLSLVWSLPAHIAFASQEIPKLKSGIDFFAPSEAELQERLNRLSHQDKEAIERVQLKQIIPDVLFSQIPYELLSKIKFSLQDDPYTRAKKFEQLGLALSRMENGPQKSILSYYAFDFAFQSLASVEGITESQAMDYYLSLAQFEIWAAKNLLMVLPNSKQAIRKLIHALSLLRKSDEALQNIPLHREIEAFLNFETMIQQLVFQMSEDDLLKMGVDPLAKTVLSTQSEVDELMMGIAEKRTQKMQNSEAFKNAQVPEAVRAQAILHYKDLQFEKLQNSGFVQTHTLAEKQTYVIQQGAYTNYLRLMELQMLPSEIARYVEDSKIESYANFIEEYKGFYQVSGGLDLRDLGAFVQKRFAEKIKSELATVQKFLMMAKQ